MIFFADYLGTSFYRVQDQKNRRCCMNMYLRCISGRNMHIQQPHVGIFKNIMMPGLFTYWYLCMAVKNHGPQNYRQTEFSEHLIITKMQFNKVKTS